jgi:N-acetylglutamate synthase-like GNAT family acetyltransferase
MSPDMNPIEHVWDFIGRKINQRNPKCQNIDELRPAILQEWQQFPQERLRRLVRSMTRRVQKFTINAVDILVIGFCALHIRTIDEFKSSLNLKTLHFNVMLKTSIKDKLVLRFSSACFEPHFCHVIVTSFRMINTSQIGYFRALGVVF